MDDELEAINEDNEFQSLLHYVRNDLPGAKRELAQIIDALASEERFVTITCILRYAANIKRVSRSKLAAMS